MADITGGEKTAGIFWIRDTSDEDQPVVFVPGVSREGNLRTGVKGSSSSILSKEKMRAGGEVKGIVGVGCVNEGRKKRNPRPFSQGKASLPSFQMKAGLHSTIDAGTSLSSPVLSPPKPTAIYCNQQAIPEAAQVKRSASLKDLCPEDKRRIANLIQELARVSEEKDETKQRLKDEQESFERKIQQLEQQNQLIVQERESLQQQYRECQELLTLYQQYLSQQQEKLNHSIAHLNHSHSKVCSNHVNRHPGGEAGLEGSYLGLPNVGRTQAGTCLNGSRLADMGGVGVGVKHGKGGAKERPAWGVRPLVENNNNAMPTQGFSSIGQDSDGNEELSQNMVQGGCSESRLTWQPRREDSDTVGRHCSQRHFCLDDDREGVEKGGVHRTSAVYKPEWAASDRRLGAARATPPGCVDWEERKHWLLLQKMELEVQRERLQAQLALQEERLIRQNQQLRQSRMDYSRFRDVATELDQNGEDAAQRGVAQHDEVSRGTVEPVKVRAPSGEAEDLGRRAAQQDGELMQQEALELSRKDAATSPTAVQTQLQPTTPLKPSTAVPKTPHSRLNSSLMELLDVFSPISVPVQRRPKCQPQHQPQPHSTRKPRPAPLSSLLSPWAPPHRCPTSPDEEAEESRILEDIFFIC
ncbi:hypothetical protein JZ751_012432 [Albula glossodonta]|uniref:Protein hinderin n=1 Tax=Albula glossodonta TaxID=121402 RepID=A0A8T2PSL9_9TELE|nr:hypothetical protein JZ751_012432 [Albula glossodonta]